MSDRYKSAEEVLEQHLRDMGPELGRVYNELSNELSRLHNKWEIYRQLFATSSARIELPNQTAAHAFGVLQHTLVGDVLMHIGRLTDPSATGYGKRRRENLTVRRLPALTLDVTLRADVDRLGAEAVTACEPIRAWRNRRLAHSDLALALSTEAIAGLSRAQIEAALAALSAVLNRLEHHYWQSTTMYPDTIGPSGDGESLVYYLRKGRRAEEQGHKRIREGQPLPEDLEHEELP